MNIPDNAVTAVVSALVGALGVIAAAVLRHHTRAEQTEIDEKELRKNIAKQLRGDLFKQYKMEREMRLAEQKRASEYRDEMLKLEDTVRELQTKVDRLQREHNAVVNRLNEDSDVGWDPADVIDNLPGD